MVQRLARLLGRLKVASGPLVVGTLEAPGAGVLMDPAVGTAQVENLPGLQFDGRPLFHTTHLDALAEPANNTVGTGGIEHVGEVLCPLAFQVVQMPLAGGDLVRVALVTQLALGDLLCVYADRVVESALLPNRQRDHRPDQLRPRPHPRPLSETGAHGRRASGPACPHTAGWFSPAWSSWR